MKTGHVTKRVFPQPEEVMVVLSENDTEVCTLYVTDDAEAMRILESWKNGTYRLLTE